MHNFNANPIVRLDSTFIVRYDGVYMSHLCMANDVAYNHQSLFAIVDPVS